MILGDDGVPEPDLRIVRGALADDDRDRRPSARDVALVVEVADSTLLDNRGDVLASHASASIPMYWIVNFRAMILEVDSQSSGPSNHPGYANRRDFGPDDKVPRILDGREIARFFVREILP